MEKNINQELEYLEYSGTTKPSPWLLNIQDERDIVFHAEGFQLQCRQMIQNANTYSCFLKQIQRDNG